MQTLFYIFGFILLAAATAFVVVGLGSYGFGNTTPEELLRMVAIGVASYILAILSFLIGSVLDV